ncbi:MAG: DUF480 domain-containing protein [Dermatophilaceae bacterium]|nr:DUF480 domain-containing protein [Dermatophilaceae bacterium]
MAPFQHHAQTNCSAVQLWGVASEEGRVLGCLVEKRLTTPQQYPLTANARSSTWPGKLSCRAQRWPSCDHGLPPLASPGRGTDLADSGQASIRSWRR